MNKRDRSACDDLMILLAALLAFARAPLLAARPADLTLFVAVDGSDANPGTKDKPLATLEGARDAIRKLRKAGAGPAPLTVYVRGGTYYLDHTFQLSAQDSGTQAAPMVYRNYGSERPRLVGGKPIKGFAQYKDHILVADLAAQGLKGVAFKQLFFDGKRQILARYPNFDAGNPWAGGWAIVDGKDVPMYGDRPDDSRRVFHYKPQERPRLVACRRRRGVHLPPLQLVEQHRPRRLDRPRDPHCHAGGRLLLRHPPRRPLLRAGPLRRNSTRRANGISTRPAASSTSGRPCRWRARPSSPRPCARSSRSAPAPRTLSSAALTLDVLRGHGPHHAGRLRLPARRQRDPRRGRLQRLRRAPSAAAPQRRRRLRHLPRSAASGIEIGGGDRNTLTPAGNYADNNYIHHIGVFYKQGVGIVLDGVGNRASHNLIHDGPRIGILFSGNNL